MAAEVGGTAAADAFRAAGGAVRAVGAGTALPGRGRRDAGAAAGLRGEVSPVRAAGGLAKPATGLLGEPTKRRAGGMPPLPARTSEEEHARGLVCSTVPPASRMLVRAGAGAGATLDLRAGLTGEPAAALTAASKLPEPAERSKGAGATEVLRAAMPLVGAAAAAALVAAGFLPSSLVSRLEADCIRLADGSCLGRAALEALPARAALVPAAAAAGDTEARARSLSRCRCSASCMRSCAAACACAMGEALPPSCSNCSAARNARIALMRSCASAGCCCTGCLPCAGTTRCPPSGRAVRCGCTSGTSPSSLPCRCGPTGTASDAAGTALRGSTVATADATAASGAAGAGDAAATGCAALPATAPSSGGSCSSASFCECALRSDGSRFSDAGEPAAATPSECCCECCSGGSDASSPLLTLLRPARLMLLLALREVPRGVCPAGAAGRSTGGGAMLLYSSCSVSRGAWPSAAHVRGCRESAALAQASHT